MWSVECGVWSVKCGVWSVECEVWSVEWEGWSVKCGVNLKMNVPVVVTHRPAPKHLMHVFSGIAIK